MKVEVTKYRKPDGYATRYWSVMVDGELLAVTVYRKGAEAASVFLIPILSNLSMVFFEIPVKSANIFGFG